MISVKPLSASAFFLTLSTAYMALVLGVDEFEKIISHEDKELYTEASTYSNINHKIQDDTDNDANSFFVDFTSPDGIILEEQSPHTYRVSESFQGVSGDDDDYKSTFNGFVDRKEVSKNHKVNVIKETKEISIPSFQSPSINENYELESQKFMMDTVHISNTASNTGKVSDSRTGRIPVIEDDISGLLSPGYSKDTLRENEKSLLIVHDEIPALLTQSYAEEVTREQSEREKNQLIFQDDIDGFLPPNYSEEVESDTENNSRFGVVKKSSSKSKLQKLQNNLNPNVKSISISMNENGGTLDFRKFGKVTTTTIDPIAAILENVVIIDPNNYLPRGYQFQPEDVIIIEEDGKNNGQNINDLLISDDGKNEISFKPGKLYGKKLAAIAKELKEAEKYYAAEGKLESKSVESKLNDDKSKDQIMREGKKISDASLEFSADSIFASILEGKEIEIDVDKIDDKINAKPKSNEYGWKDLGNGKTHSTPTSTSTTTTSTPRPTTPSVCGSFCNLAGTLYIKSGIKWSEDLLYSFTDKYQEETKQIVKDLSRIFDHVYFGKSFEFASVEAYYRRDDLVLVDVYIQFSDLVFQVTTKDVKEAFIERLSIDDGKATMGKFEIDLTWTYFLVVDTAIPEASLTATSEELGIFLPEWSLLAIVVGVISLFIIGFLGVIVCVNRHRNNQLLKKQILNPRTLDIFKSRRHFDTLEVDDATAYANDKRDLWTLQKANQNKRSKNSLARKNSFYRDSGRGSGSGIYSYIPEQIRNSLGKGGRKLCDKFPQNIIRNSSVRNHNDSGAELLEGFNTTRFDSSGDIIDKNVATTDTSYENEKDDLEGRVPSQGSRRKVESEHVNILNVQGDQGICFNDSDSSVDAVSDGPSEKF